MRRARITSEAMSVALKSAAVLAPEVISLSMWTPENPLCCSKRCRFGGRTGLWVPLHNQQRQRTAERPWWLNGRQGCGHDGYTATQPQERVAEWTRKETRAETQFVVCSVKCSEDVQWALGIIGLASQRRIFHSSKNFKILLGVDEVVSPTVMSEVTYRYMNAYGLLSRMLSPSNAIEE